MKPIIFSGSSSPKLCQEIARKNDFALGKLVRQDFANSEIKVRIETEVRNKDTIVVQGLSNPANDNLVELLFTVDALRREGAKSVTLVIPYFGYARQNIQHTKGECVSMNVVVRMLESLKVDKVITLDIHDEGSSGIFNIPFSNTSALPLLAKYIYKFYNLDKTTESQFVIGSPDQGGVERARFFADNFYYLHKNTETIVVEKKRDLSRLHVSTAVEIFGNVKNKKVLLVDDIATSGSTIINAANMCLENGAVEVSTAIVHPDFALGVAKKLEDSRLTHFFTTNSIEKPIEDLSNYSKIKIIDIASVFRF